MDMVSFFNQYGYVIIASLFAIVSIFIVIHTGSHTDETKFKWTYLFIGPYLFDLLHKEIKNRSRKKLLTKREIIGWGLFFLLLAILVYFDF